MGKIRRLGDRLLVELHNTLTTWLVESLQPALINGVSRGLEHEIKSKISFHPEYYSGVKVKQMSLEDVKEFVNTVNFIPYDIIQYKGKNVWFLIQE